MANFKTFVQYGYDLGAAGSDGEPLYWHPLCGYATGEPEDIPAGWQRTRPESPWHDLAYCWGAIAIAELAFHRERNVYEAATLAGHFGRLALGAA